MPYGLRVLLVLVNLDAINFLAWEIRSQTICIEFLDNHWLYDALLGMYLKNTKKACQNIYIAIQLQNTLYVINVEILFEISKLNFCYNTSSVTLSVVLEKYYLVVISLIFL